MSYFLRYGNGINEQEFKLALSTDCAAVVDQICTAARRQGVACGVRFAPDPLADVHQSGVEATLRARIATLEAQRNDASRRLTAANDELAKFRTERINFNLRDQRMCERIQKAEAHIREFEAEGVPALIGQRDAWRDIAQKLNTILCNQDPSHV